MQFHDFDFNGLFVFDLANNHQGSVPHALAIIRAIGAVARQQGVRGVFKFQFRDLDTLVHPAHRVHSDNKHIPRFLATRLQPSEFETLLAAVRAEGLLAMCTPFDEASVETISRMNFDLMKVASCSAKDWPLLEKVAESGLPVIFSTGGLSLRNIDNLVSFFEHRGCDFAIMHCVSIYPTPPEKCHLNQIDVLRRRYPSRTIGWSTHEDPEAIAPVQIAAAKGAAMFERHVGIATPDIQLNAYSSTPEQVDRWISAWKAAQLLCGATARIQDAAEVESIDTLRRGVFARRTLQPGEPLGPGDIYFAMPFQAGQLSSEKWRTGIATQSEIRQDEPVLLEAIQLPHDPAAKVIKTAIHEVKALLNEAGVRLGTTFEVEYSHHYGIERFREFGVVIINCINREYCKKILVQLPGQRHPHHYHKRKEETFQILHGELDVMVDGQRKRLVPGDIQLVLPGVWHAFWTDTGCVFEEVSTTHYNNDSVYRDKEIQKLERHQRKTIVDHWGRYQIGDPSAP